MSMAEEAQPGRRPGAPRGKPKTPEHRAKIAAAIRQRNASLEPWQRRRGFRRLLSDEEAEDYRHLRWRHHYTESEALVAVGREDLVG